MLKAAMISYPKEEDVMRHTSDLSRQQGAACRKDRQWGLACFLTASGQALPFLFCCLKHNRPTTPAMLPEDYKSAFHAHFVASSLHTQCHGIPLCKWRMTDCPLAKDITSERWISDSNSVCLTETKLLKSWVSYRQS